MGEAARQQPVEQRYLDIEDAAVYCGKSVSALRSAVFRGTLVPDSRGARGRHKGHRFTRETLDRYMTGSGDDE